jgi:hypothetical protein
MRSSTVPSTCYKVTTLFWRGWSTCYMFLSPTDWLRMKSNICRWCNSVNFSYLYINGRVTWLLDRCYRQIIMSLHPHTGVTRRYSTCIINTYHYCGTHTTNMQLYNNFVFLTSNLSSNSVWKHFYIFDSNQGSKLAKNFPGPTGPPEQHIFNRDPNFLRDPGTLLISTPDSNLPNSKILGLGTYLVIHLF